MKVPVYCEKVDTMKRALHKCMQNLIKRDCLKGESKLAISDVNQ